MWADAAQRPHAGDDPVPSTSEDVVLAKAQVPNDRTAAFTSSGPYIVLRDRFADDDFPSQASSAMLLELGF